MAVRIDHVGVPGLGVAFGNAPDDCTNGRCDDALGSAGRAYFTSPDGHLYEVTVHP